MTLLQSKSWEKLQSDLGETTFYEKTQDFEYLIIKKTTHLGHYFYLPYGPTIFGEDDNTKITNFKKCLSELKLKATQEHAFFIRLEPQNPDFLPILSRKPFKKVIDLNPAETWVLDLPKNPNYSSKSAKISPKTANPPQKSPKIAEKTPESPKISKNTEFSAPLTELKPLLPSRLVRYYKKSAANGISIETSKNSEDIKYLRNLQKNLAENKNIQIFSENYLETELKQPFSTLYLVKYNPNPANSPKNSAVPAQKSQNVANPNNISPQNPKKSPDPEKNAQILAAGLVFDDEITRYNLQGAQSELGASLHATGILTIQLILDAYEKNLKIFDFWGIAPENASKNHPWAGFSSFKKTFHGREVKYCGTHDLILNSKKYALYSSLRTLNRNLRKIIPK